MRLQKRAKRQLNRQELQLVKHATQDSQWLGS